MSRSLLLSAVVMAVLAVRAEAIEMFTNFHNGENVGFPPMEVPISMYRGVGHGGWAPGAQGAPLRTVPPVPAMTPTGPAPAFFHGAVPCDHCGNGWSDNQQPTYRDARNGRRRPMPGYRPMMTDGTDGKAAGEYESAPRPASPAAPTVLQPGSAMAPPLEPTPAVEPVRDDRAENTTAESAGTLPNTAANW